MFMWRSPCRLEHFCREMKNNFKDFMNSLHLLLISTLNVMEENITWHTSTFCGPKETTTFCSDSRARGWWRGAAFDPRGLFQDWHHARVLPCWSVLVRGDGWGWVGWEWLMTLHVTLTEEDQQNNQELLHNSAGTWRQPCYYIIIAVSSSSTESQMSGGSMLLKNVSHAAKLNVKRVWSGALWRKTVIGQWARWIG